MTMRQEELKLFFYRWCRDPLRLGAIVPSSRTFGKKVAHKVCNGMGGSDGFVIELGSGTGVFAQALLDEGIAPDKLALLELDPLLASFLKKRFPAIRVWEKNAFFLRQLINKHKMNPVSLVLSGLPVPSIAWRTRYRILITIRRLLEQGGVYVQLTYMPVPPIPKRVLRRIGFKVKSRIFVLQNLPPASAWVFTPCAKQNQKRQ